jgi:hypothetical protein
VTLQRGERSTSPLPPASYPDYRDLRERTRSFAGLAAYHDDFVTLTGGARPERLWGTLVSANYFDVLGARPAVGRLFLPEDEDAEGGAPVIVLAHDTWRSRFGSAPDIVGRTLEVNRLPYTVVGIAAAGFRGAKPGLRSDVFLPVTMKRQVWGGGSLDDRGSVYLNLVGRLAAGVDRRADGDGLRAADARSSRIPTRPEPSQPIPCGARRSARTSTSARRCRRRLGSPGWCCCRLRQRGEPAAGARWRAGARALLAWRWRQPLPLVRQLLVESVVVASWRVGACSWPRGARSPAASSRPRHFWLALTAGWTRWCCWRRCARDRVGRPRRAPAVRASRVAPFEVLSKPPSRPKASSHERACGHPARCAWCCSGRAFLRTSEDARRAPASTPTSRALASLEVSP